MKRKAIILFEGRYYNICCDIQLTTELMKYLMSDARHMEELKQIFQSICEKLTTTKYGNEPHGTSAMKPFLNNENDRIICKPTKRKGRTQCIVMAELFLSKKTQKVDKVLNTRYKIVGGYEYEIIE